MPQLVIQDDQVIEASSGTVIIDGLNPYGIRFDKGNKNWRGDIQANHLFIHIQELMANWLLKTQGYLFLNDVYDLLGAPRTAAGQLVGWKIDDQLVMQNNVDFGQYSGTPQPLDDELENGIALDFNVDGIIYDQI